MANFGNCVSAIKLVVLSLILTSLTTEAATIIIGNDPEKGMNIGWTDGVCYVPIQDAYVGDTLVFNFAGHNVYQMDSKASYESCNFGGAELMASASESPFSYTISEMDQERNGGNLYFACAIGSHCRGGQQKIRIRAVSSPITSSSREINPVSQFVLGVSTAGCDDIQESGEVGDRSNSFESSCSEPILKTDDIVDDGREWMFSTCLSKPITMTPGGVINQATVLHFPFPTDRRVVIGSRVWEFMEGDPGIDNAGLTPVNVNQLYVHHILGDVVLGNGAESIGNTVEDAAFPAPYGKLSGDFDDLMTFHIIDIRAVEDNWLECVECRCKDYQGNYLEIGGAGEGGQGDLAGGIDCCSNCTTLTSPTIDYRLRYNVTFMDIPEGEYIEPVNLLTADIAQVFGKSIEFDVPLYTNLPKEHVSFGDSQVQALQLFGTVRDLFWHGIYDRIFDGPDIMKIHRCAGHMHIGAIAQFIENVDTGEIICTSKANYGTDPTSNQGFLTSMDVTNFDPPLTLSAEGNIRLVTHYNASIVHTGVMGLLQIWYSDGDVHVQKDETPLAVNFCAPSTCDATKLPSVESLSDQICSDDLEASYFCIALGMCSCDDFLALPQVKGGCNGYIKTPVGNYDVTDFCAKTCKCVHLDNEQIKGEAIERAAEKELEHSMKYLCHYASKECNDYLSNLYSCADEQIGADNINANVRDLVVRQGHFMAISNSRLGHPALHRLEPALYYGEETTIPVCDNEQISSDYSSSPSSKPSASHSSSPSNKPSSNYSSSPSSKPSVNRSASPSSKPSSNYSSSPSSNPDINGKLQDQGSDNKPHDEVIEDIDVVKVDVVNNINQDLNEKPPDNDSNEKSQNKVNEGIDTVEVDEVRNNNEDKNEKVQDSGGNAKSQDEDNNDKSNDAFKSASSSANSRVSSNLHIYKFSFVALLAF